MKPEDKKPDLKKSSKHAVFSILLSLALLAPCFIYSSSYAGGPLIRGTEEVEKLDLIAGKTIVLQSKKPIKRVFVAESDIAEANVFSPTEIVLTGKGPGTTTLSLWQENNGMVGIYTLEVKYDVARLKQQLHSLFPEEKDLRIIATHDSITLSGRMSDTASLAEVMALAHSYAPKNKVNNLVEVSGVHQVMLEVRVAEMSRSLIRKLGINLTYLDSGTINGNIYQHNITTNFSNLFSTAADGGVRGLFSFFDDGGDWGLTGLIDILEAEGLTQVLAEPTLIALSGQTANFLAGGEFPVPVDEGDDGVEIEWKEFGVGLSFTPKVLSKNRINLKVQPEVSQLDFSAGIQVGGVRVPGISTRRASTTVELADGQSFAIAGLLQDNITNEIDKFPWLGDIPVLGNLFKSRAYRQNETELIIVATPHLVKPINMAEHSLPTDYYKEPSDLEFYILGLMQGRENESPAVQGELDGEFGHSMPDDY